MEGTDKGMVSERDALRGCRYFGMGQDALGCIGFRNGMLGISRAFFKAGSCTSVRRISELGKG